jgi:hypothetical protein
LAHHPRAEFVSPVDYLSLERFLYGSANCLETASKHLHDEHPNPFKFEMICLQVFHNAIFHIFKALIPKKVGHKNHLMSVFLMMQKTLCSSTLTQRQGSVAVTIAIYAKSQDRPRRAQEALIA